MGQNLGLLLRLSIIASAAAVLILGTRLAHAQTAADPVGSVYGYNPGQGLPHTEATPQNPPVNDTAPAYQAAAQQPPVQQPQLQQPQQPVPALRYGYGATDQRIAPAPQQVTASAAVPPPQAYYQAPAAPRINSDYRLGPGDKIRVTVFGETDLSGEYQVDGSGVVRLPLIGAIRAAGYTAPGLEAWIDGALSPNYLKNPKVNVEIITYRPFYIVGAVNRPGEYPYVDNMSAMNAVALAGGFMDTAKESSVYVRHEGSTVEEEVPTDQITHILPGDVIRVKTTLFWDAMSVFTPLAGPAAIAAAAIR